MARQFIIEKFADRTLQTKENSDQVVTAESDIHLAIEAHIESLISKSSQEEKDIVIASAKKALTERGWVQILDKKYSIK